ncbi:MAG TPA: dynamin family protein [Burkholderiaceae bacterium]|nr:dynamin family protein [Burkholderiaceae bacterium]
MAQLSSSFKEYSAWRSALAARIVKLKHWLGQSQLLEADVARRLDLALERLGEDRLVIAFVAEFSRGKSELINAIFFADYGKRILPSSAGRTTMCPTELMYDESLPPCIRVLPIETRARLGSMADFKSTSDEWQVYPVDATSAEGMLQAFRRVSETVCVSTDEARLYGLFDADDPDQAHAVDAAGQVEISRWRHAVINFPHPLLQQGLVILDTPGLNAIGTEPELTLSLVPSAHAVLFLLAADTGVTKSDLEVWRHISGEGGPANHLAVLNKIDGLWDALKSEEEIEEEIQKQVRTVSQTLSLAADQVFPVSAQKGLVAKVSANQALLTQSRLPLLEEALVQRLVPSKRDIVREQTVRVVERVLQEVRNALSGRERGLIEQLYELRSLQGKNQASVERMLKRAQLESREFEENVRKVVAARMVLSRLSEKVYDNLRAAALKTCVLQARERMRKARLSPQFSSVIKAYFEGLRQLLRQSNAGLLEMEKMVLGVQRKFAEDLGWSLPPPMPFSLVSYLTEIERAEAACKSHFGAIAVLTRDKWALIERFFNTVVSKSREIFAAAQRDAEAWSRSLLPPIELQVRDQRAQLRKRAESVQRVRDAQESLEDRIAMLEDALQEVQARLAELKTLGDQIEQLAARENADPSTAAAPPRASTAESSARRGSDEDIDPAYLRIDI